MPKGKYNRRQFVYMYLIYQENKSTGMSKPKTDRLISLKDYLEKVDTIIISNQTNLDAPHLTPYSMIQV